MTKQTAVKMTPVQRLVSAGWVKVQSYDDCGEALHASGKLNGLACAKRGTWTNPGKTEPLRCPQHAIKHLN